MRQAEQFGELPAHPARQLVPAAFEVRHVLRCDAELDRDLELGQAQSFARAACIFPVESLDRSRGHTPDDNGDFRGFKGPFSKIPYTICLWYLTLVT